MSLYEDLPPPSSSNKGNSSESTTSSWSSSFVPIPSKVSANASSVTALPVNSTAARLQPRSTLVPKSSNPIIPGVARKPVNKPFSLVPSTVNTTKEPAQATITARDDFHAEIKASMKPKGQIKENLNTITILRTQNEYDPNFPNDYEEWRKKLLSAREEKLAQKHRSSQAHKSHRKYSSESSDYSRSPSPEARRTKIRSKQFAPPPNLYSRSNSPRSPSPSQSRKKSDDYYYQESESTYRQKSPSPPSPPPAKPIDLDISGEEAYLRRVRMSGHNTQSQPNRNSQQISSPVIVLTNMVGAGQVDDLLEAETAEECSKYGEVERCIVFEVPNGQLPDHQAVRIYVKFKNKESAEKACSDISGRFFGGRVVKAIPFDLDRFNKLDLMPTKQELS